MARRHSRRLSDYELEEEGLVHLGDPAAADEPKARKLKAASACASTRLDYHWMRAELCISRPGGSFKDYPTMADPRSTSHFVHSVYPVASESREVGLVLAVDTKHRPLGLLVVGQGGLREMHVDLSVLLRGVLLLGASGFFFFHNHPSGEATPSQDDFNLTDQIKKGADSLKLKFLDHIILTADPDVHFSFFAS